MTTVLILNNKQKELYFGEKLNRKTWYESDPWSIIERITMRYYEVQHLVHQNGWRYVLLTARKVSRFIAKQRFISIYWM